MITGNIKRLIYNEINESLTIVYNNDERKTINMSKEEYMDMLKNGDFKRLE